MTQILDFIFILEKCIKIFKTKKILIETVLNLDLDKFIKFKIYPNLKYCCHHSGLIYNIKTRLRYPIRMDAHKQEKKSSKENTKEKTNELHYKINHMRVWQRNFIFSPKE